MQASRRILCVQPYLLRLPPHCPSLRHLWRLLRGLSPRAVSLLARMSLLLGPRPKTLLQTSLSWLAWLPKLPCRRLPKWLLTREMRRHRPSSCPRFAKWLWARTNGHLRPTDRPFAIGARQTASAARRSTIAPGCLHCGRSPALPLATCRTTRLGSLHWAPALQLMPVAHLLVAMEWEHGHALTEHRPRLSCTPPVLVQLRARWASIFRRRCPPLGQWRCRVCLLPTLPRGRPLLLPLCRVLVPRCAWLRPVPPPAA
mmetsp:Transcript_24463/g.69550  ORF Transcript_24463/g.69550 Transcript_24463/m.69550 type:complete len:257 (+) Transcript_24463:102-872(+)